MRLSSKRITALAVTGAAVSAGAAWALAGNTLALHLAPNAAVGGRVIITFSGRDNSPANVRGTFLAAVLEPPPGDGGSRCRHDLGSTEQNHPASKQLFFQKLLDTHHTGHYSVKKLSPALSLPGRWTVCAWQFNNDGRTSTEKPASHSQAQIMVIPTS